VHCLSFRRQLLVDPRHWDEALKAHAEQCASCARARERALVLEAALYDALSLEQWDDVGDVPAHKPDADSDAAPPASVHVLNRR